MEVTYQSVLCRLLILASTRIKLVWGELKQMLLNFAMELAVLLLPIRMVSGSNK